MSPPTRLTLLLLLALAPAPTRADDWTVTDTGFQLTMTTLQILDLGQTRAFLDHCPQPVNAPCIGYGEGWNPLLGPEPSRARLNLMGAGAIAGHALVSYLLPQPWRRVWQVVGISIEAAAVAHNSAALGLTMKFAL